MAKKRRRRKTSLITKAINVGILALAFQPAIAELLAGRTQFIAKIYSAGLSEGTFDKALAVRAYGPMLAAIILKKAISMVRKTARI